MPSTIAEKKAIQRKTVTYPSKAPGITIHAYIWIPNVPITAIVQISHGMAEYAKRYDDFARFLACNGFLVCANDHIGHGANCDPDDWGILPENADEIMLADMRTLQQKMKQVKPDVPYFMIGHSMGSFLARLYIETYGDDLDGAVISGTGQMSHTAAHLGNSIAHLVARMHGSAYRSKFLDRMGAGGYGKKIPDADSDFAWLNTSKHAVQRYIDDPACGFMFSAGGYCALTHLMEQMADLDLVARIPNNFPIFFVSGEEDPVGNFGSGVERAADDMRNHSHAHVKVKLYDRMRHEVLNEPRHTQVYAAIHRFLDACVAQAHES